MGYPKNTEDDVKSAQKKEELEKEIKENNQYLSNYERNNSNKKIEFVDFYHSIACN